MHGTTERDRVIKEFQISKENKGIANPSSKTVTIDGIEKQVLINSKADKSKFSMSPISSSDTVQLGAKVVWNNATFLVTELSIDHDVFVDAIIQKCNYTLPFQTTSSTIIQEPCIVLTQSEYTSGENQGNVITLAENQRVVLIQYNENTKYLVEEKRIFIDQLCDKPKVYKITKVDRISYMNGTNGLLKLTCDVDEQQQSNDRVDLKIANYISTDPSPTTTPSSSGTSYITDTKGNIYTTIKQIKVSGLAVPFDCVFKDTSGNVVQNISPKWALIVSDDLKDKVMLTYSNSYPNRVYIQVLEGNENIGKQFNLTLEDANSLFGKCTLTIQVVS